MLMSKLRPARRTAKLMVRRGLPRTTPTGTLRELVMYDRQGSAG